jgi:mannonate dehydratase
MLMPDHAPRVPHNPNAIMENFAFEWGFIRGLIMAEQHIV